MEIKATPYSNLKIFSHSDKLESIKKGEITTPIYIRIKPTNRCNHKCYYCSYADNDLALRDSVDMRDQIEWDKMSEIIDDMGDMDVKAVTFSGGGEPLVYPYIVPTMQKIIDKKIDLSIITNGQLLCDERAEVLSHAKWVRFSFDSANAKTYSKIRGIDINSFDKVCDNIKNFAKIKNSKCELGINFVINHENEKQVFEAANLVKELGANHIKYTARITKDLFEYHAPFKQSAIEQIHKAKSELEDNKFKVINKYEDDFEFSMVFERNYNTCYMQKIFTVIAADSNVYYCHDKAYVSEGVIGSLKNQSFKELWYSKETRDKFNKFDAMCECKHHCVYDDRNMLLNSYFSLDDNHINFI